MIFSQIVGHKDLVNGLKKMVKENKLPHAMLFSEQPGCGALSIILALIQFMFCKTRKAIESGDDTWVVKGLFGDEPESLPTDDSCEVCSSCIKIRNLTHPDLHFVFPINTTPLVEKGKKVNVDMYYDIFRNLVYKNPYFSEQDLYSAMALESKLGNIGVAEANWIINKLSLSAYEGGNRVVVILYPERMNAEASNKLLKIIEEPSSDTYFFLLTNAADKIIKTIRSRCRLVEVPPIERDELATAIQQLYKLPAEESKEWAECSMGSLGKAIELIDEADDIKENFEEIISLLTLAKEKKLPDLLDIGSDLASRGKEAQKQYCQNALKVLRELYMFRIGKKDLAYCSPMQREVLDGFAKSLRGDFFSKAYNIFNNTIECIERNVNAKMAFCDMCNMLYINI